MIATNLLDDMRVDLLFNGLARDAQRVLVRQRRACTVRDYANAIYPEKRTAAVLFIIRLVLNRSNGIPRKESADFSHPCTHELVLEPLKHRHRDRFARFQDNVANEVKRTWSQHLEYFLGQFGALNILVAERDQANGRILVMENMT